MRMICFTQRICRSYWDVKATRASRGLQHSSTQLSTRRRGTRSFACCVHTAEAQQPCCALCAVCAVPAMRSRRRGRRRLCIFRSKLPVEAVSQETDRADVRASVMSCFTHAHVRVSVCAGLTAHSHSTSPECGLGGTVAVPDGDRGTPVTCSSSSSNGASSRNSCSRSGSHQCV